MLALLLATWWVARLSGCDGLAIAGETHGTAWRRAYDGGDLIRAKGWTRVAVPMGAGEEALRVYEFEIRTGADWPDSSMGNRLEDADESTFAEGLICDGTSRLSIPTWPPRPGSSARALCDRKCAIDLPRAMCSDPAAWVNWTRGCDCSIPPEDRPGYYRRTVAVGSLWDHPTWGHAEWIVASISPAQVLGSDLRGLALETYLPRKAVGMEVRWVLTHEGGRTAGTSTIEFAVGNRDAFLLPVGVACAMGMAGLLLAAFAICRSLRRREASA